MLVSDFDYQLPESYIAKSPADKRDQSKLLVMDRETGDIEHRCFHQIVDYLKPGDTLVLNNSKVIPARIFGTKESTGAKIEFLLIGRKQGDIWEAMAKPGKKLKTGDKVLFSPDLTGTVVGLGQDGTRLIDFHYQGNFMEILDEIGAMPLPPYIDRGPTEEDKDRYQTVYCKEEGSVAAPTAGLHFTEELLSQIENLGVNIAYVTLHVGIGTFRPVKVDTVTDHQMHFEEYNVDQEAAELINQTKAKGGRIITVGTTSTRTIESAADNEGRVMAGNGSTGIFIYPGYKFKVIDGLITNFHLPKSTLIMLVSAFSQRDKVLNAYEVAKAEGYRFFSYGDAMFLK